MITDEGRARKERREAEEQALSNDKPAALAVCRAIRDNPDAADADRLEAIRLIHRITNPR